MVVQCWISSSRKSAGKHIRRAPQRKHAPFAAKAPSGRRDKPCGPGRIDGSQRERSASVAGFTFNSYYGTNPKAPQTCRCLPSVQGLLTPSAGFGLNHQNNRLVQDRLYIGRFVPAYQRLPIMWYSMEGMNQLMVTAAEHHQIIHHRIEPACAVSQVVNLQIGLFSAQLTCASKAFEGLVFESVPVVGLKICLVGFDAGAWSV